MIALIASVLQMSKNALCSEVYVVLLLALAAKDCHTSMGDVVFERIRLMISRLCLMVKISASILGRRCLTVSIAAATG